MGEAVDVIHLNVKLENLFCGKIVTQSDALLKMKYLKDFLGVPNSLSKMHFNG